MSFVIRFKTCKGLKGISTARIELATQGVLLSLVGNYNPLLYH